jgi:cyclase
MTHAHVSDRAELPAPSVEEVSPGVFAYVQPDGGWGLNNAGFIVAPDHVVVIDTCFTEKRARAFLEAAGETAGGERPLRTLINTHHHGDHTHGNWLLGPGATIIGHERCREEVLATGTGTTAFFPGVDWGKIEVSPPAVTFRERLTVWAGDLELELLYMGPAHTTNDIVVWIPERRVLFSGDLIFNGGMPFLLMGSLAGSLEAMGRLRALGAERIVPGHGAVCGPEAIDEIEEYLRFLEDAARRGFEAGKDALEAARETELGKFGEWLDSERFAANMHRAYSELRGEARGTPLPPSAIGDMIAYNGGQMPRCLA